MKDGQLSCLIKSLSNPQQTSPAALEFICASARIITVIRLYLWVGRRGFLSYIAQGIILWSETLTRAQVNKSFLHLLIGTPQKHSEYIYIHRMLDYLKYETVFEKYKKGSNELESHNIITYLTSIILSKARKTTRDFGFNFCADCVSYFTGHSNLLKDAYWAQYEIDSHFDYDGKELKAILDLDKNFIDDGLKSGKIGVGYSSALRLEKVINKDII